MIRINCFKLFRIWFSHTIFFGPFRLFDYYKSLLWSKRWQKKMLSRTDSSLDYIQSTIKIPVIRLFQVKTKKQRQKKDYAIILKTKVALRKLQACGKFWRIWSISHINWLENSTRTKGRENIFPTEQGSLVDWMIKLSHI